jgi:hypothetical protein
MIAILATNNLALVHQRLIKVGEFIDSFGSADGFIPGGTQPWKTLFEQGKNPFDKCPRTHFFGSHTILLKGQK